MRNRFLMCLLTGALASACSSSTGPSAGTVGNWHVTVSNIVAGNGSDTFAIRPSPFTLAISESASVWRATYPTLYGIATNGDTVYQYSSAAAGSSFTVSGDSIKLVVDNGTQQCLLHVEGPVGATSASGAAALTGLCGPTTSGSWSASKF